MSDVLIAMKQFRADLSYIQDTLVISLNGELDASSSLKADAALEKGMKSGAKALCIDCRALNYISSAGLGVLLAAFQVCNEKEIKLVFFGLKPKIRNVFEIIGLQKILTIVPTLEEALTKVT